MIMGVTKIFYKGIKTLLNSIVVVSVAMCLFLELGIYEPPVDAKVL